MARAGLDTHTLVLAAAELADEHGMEEVTLAALAAKLGVRSPSLYNHINGLAGLRTLMAVYGLEQLYEIISQATEGLSGEAALHAMSQAYLGFTRAHPGLYQTTLQAPEPGDTALEAASAKILSLIIQLISAFGLDEEGNLHAARGLRSILHGLSTLEHQGGFGMPLDLNVTLTRLINTYIAGIRCMGSDAYDKLN